ncbi:MAG TPA: regulatory protein RecX [Firmicutes bacterium]|nr:regulatory protein RecX [Bacillota bacterium]
MKKARKTKQTKSDIKAAAVRLLTVRDRSVGELRERLRKNFADADDEIDEVLAYLEGIGYLDDRRFAQNHVASRNRFRPRGNFMLRLELKKKSIADAVIEEVLNPREKEYELALSLAAQRLGRLKNIEYEKRVQRLGSLLERRGFPSAVRRRVLGELLDRDL